jgi:SAM-dependent methyltransferase
MPSCVSCGHGAATLLYDKRMPGDGAVIHLYRCDACGLVFLGEWQSDFDRSLYAYYEGMADLPREAIFQPINTGRQEILLDRFARATSGRSLLDVGCGVGHMVDTARRKGWSARGIDLATGAIDIARKFGVRADTVDFFAPELDGERFDVVFMSEFIEHVPSPGRFLARAEALLAPGGLVYLTTPNHAGLGRRFLGSAWSKYHPEHFSYFSPKSMKELVDRHTNLTSVEVRTRNIDVALFRLGRRSRAVASGDATGSAPGVSPVQALRARVASNAGLRVAKTAANTALSATGTGETITALLRRDASARG